MDPNTLIDAAFKVCTALDAAGAKAVLTGGSAATFYAPQAYQSDDVDFILMWTAGGSQAANALAAINVKQVRPGDYRYGNVTVEFPKGPLSIGAEQIPSERCITERRNGMVLHVLSPTDAVCNRLESYYAYNARPQARSYCKGTRLTWSLCERGRCANMHTSTNSNECILTNF